MIFRRKYLLSFLLSSWLVSCTGDFDEINTNPSLVTSDRVDVNNILANVQKNAVFESYESGYMSEFSGYYANQATIALSNRDWANPFNSDYRNFIINISEIIRLTADDPVLVNKNAIARIWKVWLFHQLTDLYGDVPYSEAALGVNEAVNYPKYDTQETIYRDMLNELKEAEQQLSDAGGLLSFGTADLIYNGNVENWRRFANSLRLRLAIRVRFADAGLSTEHIREVISKPLITDNSQNAQLETEGAEAANVNNRNPIYNRYVSNTIPMYTTTTVVENLLKRNDPRLPIYVLPAPEPENGDLWRGRPFALALDLEEEPWRNSLMYREELVARLGTLFYQAQYKIKLLTASEVSFLRAEAALAGISSEQPVDLLKSGISLAMQMYNIDAGAIQEYTDQQAELFSAYSAEKKFEEIIVQKWLANYFQSKESWAEYRRTGYPLIWVGKQQGDTDGKVPRRLTYPTEEYLRNEKSVNEAVAKLGSRGDHFMSRVWWDAREGLPFDHPRQGMFPPVAP